MEELYLMDVNVLIYKYQVNMYRTAITKLKWYDKNILQKNFFKNHIEYRQVQSASSFSVCGLWR